MIAGLCGEYPLKRLSVWGKVASHAGRDEKQAPLKTPAWKAKRKGEKITRRRKGKGESMCLVIAEHLSARSVSVTWIHWNVINFAGEKEVGRQHTTITFFSGG